MVISQFAMTTGKSPNALNDFGRRFVRPVATWLSPGGPVCSWALLTATSPVVT
jgi:hypothetical protein